MRENKTRPSPGPPRAARPHRAWWLLAGKDESRDGLLTVCGAGERLLPAFSHEEEARMFLWLDDAPDDGCRVTKISPRDLASLLLGPHADLDGVALDPLPGMAKAGTIGLVRVDRERFVGLVASGGAGGHR